eukprot:g6623.t1
MRDFKSDFRSQDWRSNEWSFESLNLEYYPRYGILNPEQRKLERVQQSVVVEILKRSQYSRARYDILNLEQSDVAAATLDLEQYSRCKILALEQHSRYDTVNLEQRVIAVAIPNREQYPRYVFLKPD